MILKYVRLAIKWIASIQASNRLVSNIGSSKTEHRRYKLPRNSVKGGTVTLSISNQKVYSVMPYVQIELGKFLQNGVEKVAIRITHFELETVRNFEHYT